MEIYVLFFRSAYCENHYSYRGALSLFLRIFSPFMTVGLSSQLVMIYAKLMSNTAAEVVFSWLIQRAFPKFYCGLLQAPACFFSLVRSANSNSIFVENLY